MKDKYPRDAKDDAQKYLAEQTTLLYASSVENLEGRFTESFVLLASAVTALSAINELALSDIRYSSEILMLARAALEKMTNYMYSTVCSESDYKRFLLYPYYRSYHNLNRQKHNQTDTLTLKFNSSKDIEELPQYKEALEVFSKENPRLKWSKDTKNLDEKLAYIQEKTGLPSFVFLLNSLLIYGDASEALHGSLYGAVSMLGVYEPPFSKDGQEADGRIRDKLTMIYLSLGDMAHILITWLAQEHPGDKKIQVYSENSKDRRQLVYKSLKKL